MVLAWDGGGGCGKMLRVLPPRESSTSSCDGCIPPLSRSLVAAAHCVEVCVRNQTGLV